MWLYGTPPLPSLKPTADFLLIFSLFTAGGMAATKFDLVVLGATGYTGQYVAEEVSSV